MIYEKARRLTLLLLAGGLVASVLSGCLTNREADDVAIGEAPTPVAQTTPETTGDDDDGLADDDQTSIVEGFPVSVESPDGRIVTLDARPERIISLSAGATESLFAIGAGEQIIAVEIFSDYPPEAQDLPALDAYQPDPEAIVDLEPDLVLVIYDADGIVSILADLGVNVFYLEAPRSLDELFEQIRLLGTMTGNAESASELADSLEARVASVVDELGAVEQGPRIYHELDESLFSVSPNSFIGDVYETLRAQNIAAGAMGEYPQLSEEAILERDPEVIITPTRPWSDEDPVEIIRNRPGWDVIDAVANDRIYVVDGDEISRPGPRIVDVLEELAALLYPELFETSHEPVFSTTHIEIAA